MHTNYTELSRRTLGGPLGALVGSISHVMNGLLCSIHTHQVPSFSPSISPGSPVGGHTLGVEEYYMRAGLMFTH